MADLSKDNIMEEIEGDIGAPGEGGGAAGSSIMLGTDTKSLRMTRGSGGSLVFPLHFHREPGVRDSARISSRSWFS